MKEYFRYLDMPSFDDPNCSIDRQSYRTVVGKEIFPSTVHSFLEEKGFSIYTGECFYTPPFTIRPIHHDTQTPSDIVKINWVFGGEGSFMAWYRANASGTEIGGTRGTGSSKFRFATLEREQCTEIARAYMGVQPALVNVGRFHGVSNDTPFERYCYCAVITRDSKRVSWDQAIAALCTQ